MTRGIQSQGEFGKHLIKSLGLEGRAIKKVTLTFEVGSLVTASIEEVIDKRTVDRVLKLCSQAGHWEQQRVIKSKEDSK